MINGINGIEKNWGLCLFEDGKGVGPIPGIQYRVVELNCVALLQGSEMSP